ncbi:hypothetical protein CHLV4139_08005 [Campylobacter helveticus]|uniref:hypothetical protein n=1 Tax=Campylobacter helveticus TaxID=28898 RepID=UPI00214C407F|nr:hypothetical protein [Campylobacter helveticus]MCR2055433.1 hypothetical protein [Campylobacter helveticus]
MIDLKQKAKIRLFYESNFENGKEVAARFNVNYRTLMKWVEKEKWQKGYLVESTLKENTNQELLKKEFGSRLDMQSKKIQENIKNKIENLKDFESLSCEEFNLELEKISDKLLTSALSAEFIHKNMLESFLYAKHELKRMSLLRKESQANPAIIAMSEKVINMLSNIQKSLYSKDLLEHALNNSNNNLDLKKLSENELKALAGEIIEIN